MAAVVMAEMEALPTVADIAEFILREEIYGRAAVVVAVTPTTVTLLVVRVTAVGQTAVGIVRQTVLMAPFTSELVVAGQLLLAAVRAPQI
jgi:hypothetical protein